MGIDRSTFGLVEWVSNSYWLQMGCPSHIGPHMGCPSLQFTNVEKKIIVLHSHYNHQMSFKLIESLSFCLIIDRIETGLLLILNWKLFYKKFNTIIILILNSYHWN